MENLNERLIELCNKRTQIIGDLLVKKSKYSETKIIIEDETFNIKLKAIISMNNASQEEIKTIFSNESKRKLYTENKIAKSEKLSSLIKFERALQDDLLSLESKDRIAKIEERFLFKQIELYIAEKGKE